jgi:hypothetical protein
MVLESFMPASSSAYVYVSSSAYVYVDGFNLGALVYERP